MEQRRSTRIPVDACLMLAIPGLGLAPVRASDVSAGGACVQIARPAATDMVNEMKRAGSRRPTVPAFEAWQIA